MARDLRYRGLLAAFVLATILVMPLLTLSTPNGSLSGTRAGGLGALAARNPLSSSSLFARGAMFSVSNIAMVSSPCDSGSNAEVEQAVDLSLGYVYETWMGCRGIAFARSTDGGLAFDTPISVPGSIGSNVNVWDPAVAVAPDGTVYAAFMRAKGSNWYPVVAASFDHGKTFPQVSSLVPPVPKNWGDRDFITVAPDGTVYLTWDYGPERTSVNFICTTGGSCAFATGDLNVVIQSSMDQGRTWSQIVPISPGFPASGGDSAPILVEPNGRIDVLYQGYQITSTTTFAMDPAYSYFTSSTDRGVTWTTPVRVGPTGLTMSLAEWWIDGSLGIDKAGNLYATWDTQGTAEDIGWLSFSRDHGQTWSPIIRVTPDQDNAPHIMEVAGGDGGTAYVEWLSNNSTLGYALYVIPFSITSGLLTPPIRVSIQYGDSSVWPGDTMGVSSLGGNKLVVSWGSGVPVRGQPKSQIFAAVLEF